MKRYKQKGIREMLGMTQEDLAAWLGVSRATVAKYELRQRLLPRDANLRFARLHVLVNELDKKQKIASASAKPFTATAKGKISDFVEDCDAKAQTLERKLKKLEEIAPQSPYLLPILKILQIETAEETQQKKWLNSKEFDLTSDERYRDNSEIALLKIRIKALRLQESEAKELVADSDALQKK